MLATFAMSVVLIVNLMGLQIEKRSHYSTLAENNRLRFAAITPPRGILYERNGLPVATNRTLYRLELTPSLLDGGVEATIARLQNIITLTTNSIDRFKQAAAKRSPFQSTVLKPRLTEAEIAQFTVDRHRFNGVDIVGELGRHYPYREAFSHAVGYIGLLDANDLASVDRGDYRGTRYIGKVGVEKNYEELLHGKPGMHTIEVNARGRVIREISKRRPQAGHDILLTLDRDLQTVAYNALGGYEGAVVVMDPRNGDVLALVSKPAYDPNRFFHGFTAEEYRELVSSPRRHLFHRVVLGQYPPGSIIKPLVALAGLRHNVTSPGYYLFAGPHFSIPGNTRKFHDWKPMGHGWVNLRDSIAQSCDVYFYDLAHRIGIDRLQQTFESFGLGKASGLDIAGEASGIVPSRGWKKARFGHSWFPEETVITGIGQGYLLTTPLQLAVATAIIANRGVRVSPRLVSAVRDDKKNWKSKEPSRTNVVEASPEHWDLVINGMIDAVHRPNGTAYRIGVDAPYIMAGKTGTAQIFSISEEHRVQNIEVTEKHLMDHALFIAFAPADDPMVVITVVVEHVGSGAKYAAPIARRVLDVYFAAPTAISDNSDAASS